MSPKRRIAPPSTAERVRRLATTVLARLHRIDRRLWPPMAAAVLVLVTVLTSLPGAFWLLAVIKPLLLGCALWLLYECLRHLLITRVNDR